MSTYTWSPFRRVVRVQLKHMTYNEADRQLKADWAHWRIAKEEDANYIGFGDWDKLKVYLEEIRIERTRLGKIVDAVRWIFSRSPVPAARVEEKR